MILDHVHAFAAAMERHDMDAMLSHMRDDIVLRTPLVAEPFHGKAAIRPVVTALLATVDAFEIREFMQGPEHVSAFIGVRVGPHELDGLDLWRVDETGLIREMAVFWRPLPAATAVADILAATD